MNKKLYEIPDNKNDFLETTRRLYRGATEIAKKLEEQQSCAQSPIDVFTPEAAILRAKLKDYCERLIFKDPVGHARKIEQLLWRRGFYDAISLAKKLNKSNVWSGFEKSQLSTHLAAGVGFYNHLIFRLLLEYKLDIDGLIDFTYPQMYNDDDDYISNNNKTSLLINNNKNKIQIQSEESQQCAIRIVHRCLVCLGDLARYKLEFDDNWDAMIAMRHYKVAIAIDPSIGMPHNQLGTLAANKNHGIDAVYYYLRATLCAEAFDGAEGNLNKIISSGYRLENEKSPCQVCAVRLLCLLQRWNTTSTTTASIEKMNEASQSLLDAIETHLMIMKKQNEPNKSDPMLIHSIKEMLEIFKNQQQETLYLTDAVVFKIVAICLMSMSKLQKKKCKHVNGVAAFILSILSKIIQITILRLQESIKNKQIDENKHLLITKKEKKMKNRDKSKSLLSKLRRPKKRINSSSSESDVSDFDETLNCPVSSSQEEFDSDISESEQDFYNNLTNEENEEESDDDDDDEEDIVVKKHFYKSFDNEESKENVDSNKSNIINNNNDNDDGDKNVMINVTLMKKDNLNPSDYMDILADEGLLVSIKICFDWLRDNKEILKLAFKGSQLLLDRITILINLINIDIIKMKNLFSESMLFFSNEKLYEFVKTVPLPEDIDLKGLSFLNVSHGNIDWKILRNLKINNQEETLLRCLKIIDFANYLCTIDEFGLKFDETKRVYVVLERPRHEIQTSPPIINIQNNEKTTNQPDSDNSKGKLMRHMGELWLKAEVKALESRLKSKLMSPYLVPDQDVLTRHTPLLKRLVYSKKFIIVVPSIVVSALDDVKKTSSQAREATRWLEGQLRKGSRFLRAQRPQERLSLPYIKGPRPKDKEAWLFFQIIECCYYLTQQTKVGLNADAEPPVVTLLTGLNGDEQKTLSAFSPTGLAKSAGVNLEHIESFHSKWKLSNMTSRRSALNGG